jgi:hypothetical protein
MCAPEIVRREEQIVSFCKVWVAVCVCTGLHTVRVCVTVLNRVYECMSRSDADVINDKSAVTHVSSIL